MKKISLLILLTLISSVSILSQKKIARPNFSGIWNLDKSKSTFAKEWKLFSENSPLNCSVQVIITHREPKFSVKKIFYCHEKNSPQANSTTTVDDMIFYTDGREEKNNIPDYVILPTKTYWSGWKIIIRDRLDNSTEEYSLSDGGNTLLVRTYSIPNIQNSNKHLLQIKQELKYNLSNK